MLKGLRIFGAGIRAQIVVDLVETHFRERYRIEGYYEDKPLTNQVGPGGYQVLGTIEQGCTEMREGESTAFVCLGTRVSIRGWEILHHLISRQVEIAQLISPHANISPSAIIGPNALVFPGGYVGCSVTIGSLLCMHGVSVVEHHSKLGDNVLVAPGVAVASDVTIGSHSFLGVGTKVTPRVRIGVGALIGAGSVVVKDIMPHVVAFGHPACRVRRVKEDDEVPTEDAIATASRFLNSRMLQTGKTKDQT